MTDNQNASDARFAELQIKIEDLEDDLEQAERRNEVMENVCFGLEQEHNKAQTKLHDAYEQISVKNKMLEGLSAKLSKYLSPQVFESIFSGKQEVRIASQRKKLTVFFSDIVSFTETTSNLEAEELSNLLNHYLTEMSKIALEHGGTIDKYVGDAILIFFGDPESQGVKEDAKACVQMAIAMQRRMRELEQEWRDRGLERPLHIRIGINTGFCTVGNFGSQDRMDYTIIGNEVNLASRLESSVELGGILMAHETYSLVKVDLLRFSGELFAHSRPAISNWTGLWYPSVECRRIGL